MPSYQPSKSTSMSSENHAEPTPAHTQQNPRGHAKWFASVDDRRIPAPRRVLSVSVLRAQASIPPDQAIVRDHNSPDDEVLAEHAEVDLADGNVFYTVSRHEARPPLRCMAPAKIAFSVDDRVEETLNRHQTAHSLLELFGLGPDLVLFRDYETPCDEQIKLAAEILFDQGPVFYTRTNEHNQPHLVQITINGKPYQVRPGNHPVVELKNLADPKIPKEDILCIMVDGVPKPLDDKDHVDIKGGEVFASNCPSGGAS